MKDVKKRSDEEWLAFEQEAYKSIPLIVEQYGEYLELLWRTGDGYGGGILACLQDAMIEADFDISIPETYVRDLKKEKIKASIREEIHIRDNYTCVICGSRRKLTIDHIHPEKHGGTLELSNLQTLCRSCNSSKGARI